MYYYMKNCALLVLSFLCSSLSVFAQITAVSGTILSKTDRKPIAYAEVQIKGKNSGTITNTKGEFTLNAEISSENSLVISHLSYQIKTITASGGFSKKNMFFLEPRTVLLGEVEVESLSVLSYLKNALSNSRQNMVFPLRAETYYREFINENGEYTKFADGILDYDIFGPYQKPKTKVLVRQSRTSQLKTYDKDEVAWDFTSRFDLEKAFDPFSLNGLQLIIENSDRYLLKKQVLVGDDNEDLVEVQFMPKPNTKECFYKGSVLIDGSSRNILSFHYELEKNEQKQTRGISLLVIKGKLLQRSVSMKFKQVGTMLFPFYTNKKVEMKIWNKKKIDETFLFLSDLMVFDCKQGDAYVAIPKKEAYKKKALYPLGNNYQSNFWENINTIRLTADEEEIIEQLK